MNTILQRHQEFCQYQIVFKNNTPRTIKWFKEVINYFVKHTEVYHIEDVTQNVIKQWLIHGKCEKNWSAKTIRTRLGNVRLFFKWCVARGYLEKNPADDIPAPKLESKIPKHLTKEQSTLILDWAKCYPYHHYYEKPRAVAILAVFLFTGIRLQELLNLKINDVNIKENVLFVQAGKGKKDRMIPINAQLKRYLEKYLAIRSKINNKSVYFFVSLICTAQMSAEVIPRLLRKIGKKSGVHIHAHLLRHTFAVLMLEAGCNLFSVSRLLGHSDIKTTTIYLSATVHHLQDQVSKHPLQ
ncbi:MAG: tyrosine-type recombinase/integrase [Flavobacteriaceae bacterium]|nr:MAG: tyrosine-type recombinase/integrase [Flavobacteriaceae bacterium]